MFNPYKGHRGGAQQGKELTGDAALEAYLTEVDFSKEDIKARMKELKTKASITVPNVFLDKEHLRPFGY